jgi:hypothetical protein
VLSVACSAIMQLQEALMHSLIRYCFAVAIGLSATPRDAGHEIEESMEGDAANFSVTWRKMAGLMVNGFQPSKV